MSRKLTTLVGFAAVAVSLSIPGAWTEPEPVQEPVPAFDERKLAPLLANPRSRELEAEIRAAEQRADEALGIVHRWLVSEAEVMFARGQEQPTIELAGQLERVREWAAELDPLGRNKDAFRYAWLRLDFMPMRGWGQLQRNYATLSPAERAEFVDDLSNYPWRFVVEDEDMWDHAPEGVWSAWSGVADWNRFLVLLIECARSGDRNQCSRLRREALSQHSGQVGAEAFGGTDSLTPERLARAEEAARALEDLSGQWQAKLDATAALKAHFEALAAFQP